MPRLSLRQIVLSLVVVGLFAPVFLSVGSPVLRPSWLMRSVAFVPISVWIVVALIFLLVVLTWAFSGSMFAGEDSSPTSKEGL